ncbi:MAG: adenosylcobinamide-GDP ribazoletransferase [Tepidanaerobacteraceae bacterium]
MKGEPFYTMGFYVALLFLTRIPLPQVKLDENKIASSLPFFPLAGAVIGGILTLIYILGQRILPEQVVAGIIVVMSIIITGGMHLDGFADTMDGLFCFGDREKKLTVMKDSRTGAYGVIGLILIILLKYLLISSLSKAYLIPALIGFPIISRWMMTFAIVFYPYARENGLGKAFAGQKLVAFIFAGIITILINYITVGLEGLIVVFGVFAAGFLFIQYILRQLGGMTGDTYGAINEFCEIMALLMFSILSFRIG